MNGIYDWGWLRADGGIVMPPSDRLEEVGALATLIDENQFKYSLDALCERYGLPGKDEALLRQAVEAAGFASGRKKISAKEYIWQLPARFVGPYAEADAVSTLAAVREAQSDPGSRRDARRLSARSRSAADGAGDAPPRHPHRSGRRRAGARSAAGETRRRARRAFGTASARASAWTRSTAANGRSRPSTQYGIGYPRTAKGNPSFAAGKSGWMVKHEHWLPQLIATASKYDAAGHKFLEGHILEHIVNGRIHAEIHPFRAEDGGTRSSRFSYSNPPLQQMPSRDKELGPLIRGVFLPEDGEMWAKPDVASRNFASSCTTPCSTICRAPERRPRSTATIPTPTFTPWSRR